MSEIPIPTGVELSILPIQTIGPNDIIVVRTQDDLSTMDAKELLRTVSEAFKSRGVINNILVLTSGMSIEVYHPSLIMREEKDIT